MEDGEAENYNQPKGSVAMLESMITEGNFAIISACIVGLFTGICVVLFNIAVRYCSFLLFYFLKFLFAYFCDK